MHRMGEELLTVAHAEGIDLKKSDVEDVIRGGAQTRRLSYVDVSGP